MTPSPIEAHRQAEVLDACLADLARAHASGNPSRIGLAAMDAWDASMALTAILSGIIDHAQATEVADDRAAARARLFGRAA